VRFDVVETVSHPPDLVFRTHRDRLPETAAFLDEVERVECRSTTEHASGVVEQVHLWFGSPRVLPVLLRPFVPAHLLRWRQRTLWDPVARVARWEIDVPGLGTAVESRGTNQYALAPDGRWTRLAIEGELSFRPERLEGLEKAVPPGTAPMVEKAAVSLIVPMVQRTGAAVSRVLGPRPG
jgi:hypothetical protein